MQVGTAQINSSEMALLVESPEVYSPHMAKPAGQQALGAAESLGALRERLDNAIKWGWISLGSITVAMGIALGSISLYYLPAKIDSQVSPNLREHGERLAKIEQKVNDIDENQRKLLPMLLQEFLKRPTSGKREELRKKVTLAQALIVTATKHRVLSNPDEMVNVGQTLQEIRSKDPDLAPLAWQTLNQLITYQSFLQSQQKPAPPIPGATRRAAGIHAAPGVRFRVSQSIFENVEQALDGGTWKDIVFRNCLIKYNGGPLTLEDVHFENCQFQIAASPRGEELGELLLASNAPRVQVP